MSTENKFFVGLKGEQIIIMRLPINGVMSKSDALNLAANLVAIADDHDQFPGLLEAIKNT